MKKNYVKNDVRYGTMKFIAYVKIGYSFLINKLIIINKPRIKWIFLNRMKILVVVINA